MNHSNAGLDKQTFAIGILSVTACVLLVGFLLVTMMPQPAYAIGQNDRGGDYVIMTQQISTSVEAIVVIDAASKGMILYTFDYNAKKIRQIAVQSLKKLPIPKRK